MPKVPSNLLDNRMEKVASVTGWWCGKWPQQIVRKVASYFYIGFPSPRGNTEEWTLRNIKNGSALNKLSKNGVRFFIGFFRPRGNSEEWTLRNKSSSKILPTASKSEKTKSTLTKSKSPFFLKYKEAHRAWGDAQLRCFVYTRETTERHEQIMRTVLQTPD